MNKLMKLRTALVALAMTPAAFAVNVQADAATEQNRIRLAERDVLVFTADGNLTVNEATTVDLLMVGGGGGGGANSPSQILQGGGGGGAGGVVYKQALTLQPGEYVISIGAGGEVGSNGGDTAITKNNAAVLTAFGGGGGGAYGGNNGSDGASGGGATTNKNFVSGGAAIYEGSDNLGNAGGAAVHIYGAGGGGGAGEVGETPSGSTPGGGGDGVEYAIVGTNVWYGGGGAGFRGKAQINGGRGGGGSCVQAVDKQSSTPQAGADGLGGGGCGGAKGGKGVVVVSFVSTCAGDSSDFALSGGDEMIPLYEDTVLVFRESGTLNVAGSGLVEILAVGGGGGGGVVGTTYGAGGGGAGGVVHFTNMFVSAGAYPIVVGAGGGVGTNGCLTSALGVLAFGGGAGAKADSTHVGYDGASGGGAANANGVYTETAGGAALYAVYANKGSAGGATVHPYGAGGGGGATMAGEKPTGDTISTPGDGGDGYCCAIVGTNVWYGGGGAGFRGDGNRNAAAHGGLGGGGTCRSKTEPGAGVDGFGGGGTGGAPGGSGIVIVRYRKVSYETVFSGATGGSVKRRASHFIHTFSDNGTFTMPTNGLVEVLLVGGGGGGGANSGDNKLQGGAGGGAGGVIHLTNVVLATGSYAITIGGGGGIGTNGENTVAFNRIAYGGGAGAKYDSRKKADVTVAPYGKIGSGGASGGGSTHITGDLTTDVPVEGGSAIYTAEGNLGHAGGVCTHVYAASGGGGAGTVGGNSDGTTPGCGGSGYLCSISGRAEYYGGGGAGFRSGRQVDGGLGGGGSCELVTKDSLSVAHAGTDGLGGGGCGGAAGGKGVVIVRYATEPIGMMLIFR